jgi:N-acyl-L-homoserine lactone synthetase
MQAEYKGRSSFVDSVIALMGRLECRRATRKADLTDVFRLRYRAYYGTDLIKANRSGLSVDAYDLMDSCQIFGLYLDGEIVAAIRTHLVDQATPTSPSVFFFPGIFNPYLRQGASFIDGTRFCVSPERTAELSHLPFLTVRIAFMASIHFEADYNISLIRGEHGAFYRRYFGFETWAAEQTVDAYDFPVDLYVGEMASKRAAIEARMPFMSSSFEERLLLFGNDMKDQGVTSLEGSYGMRVTHPAKDTVDAAGMLDLLAVANG